MLAGRAERSTTPAPRAQPVRPLRDVRIQPDRLASARPFNCSALLRQGRLLLAYRTVWGWGSRLCIAALDHATYQPRGPSWHLLLDHPLCAAGQEDPRLFVHGGQLHLAFIGARATGPAAVCCQQMFARLTDDLAVAEVWHPAYAGSQAWEKNWQPFSHGGALYAVYGMCPWQVLHLHAGCAVALPAAHLALPWSAGLPRGGAPPVLVGDEYYCWFHGTDKSDPGLTRYSVGVCTFAARPPFRPRRCTQYPVMLPNEAAVPRSPSDPRRRWYASVVFPGGAYLDRGRWVVSYGYHDSQCRLAVYDAAAIEERLSPLEGGSGAGVRAGL